MSVSKVCIAVTGRIPLICLLKVFSVCFITLLWTRVFGNLYVHLPLVTVKKMEGASGHHPCENFIDHLALLGDLQSCQERKINVETDILYALYRLDGLLFHVVTS